MKNLYLSLLLSSISALTLNAQVPSYIPTNGLVGWWPFNGNANDESGNGNNGTVNGATLTTDRFGVANKAYNFDGVNDYIDYQSGSNSTLNLTSNFSVTFWLKTSSTGSTSRTIISFGDQLNNNSGGVTIGLNDGITQPPYGRLGYATQGQWRQSTSLLNDNAWHFIVITWETGVFRLYIDNVLNNQSTNQLPILSWNGARRIGAGNYAMIGFYKDLLDDIGIWNRALTPNEIAALYNNTAGTVSALNCSNFIQTGYLFSGLSATNVSATVPYTGGNGGFFAGQSISSTGITGLTATLSSGTLANGSGTVIYSISGTPSGIGNAIFAISIGGQTCNLSIPVTSLAAQYPANSVFCANGPTVIVDVTNPTTGRTWMDRNLGATQAATSSTDQNAYGDLYQWGRGADGHQCRTSSTTATLSSVDQPANGNFILAPNAPTDWRNPQNVNLWQGVNGTNNPCPCGYRIPTEQEWDAERQTWSAQNANGGINSPLKISLGGDRFNNNGALTGTAQYATFWTSTVSTTFARDMYVTTSGIGFNPNDRADGRSIRCIKEVVGSLGAINCIGSTQSGNLYSGVAASNVSITVPYTGGNGGFYHTQNSSSTGVTGLTASLSQGILANGNGSLIFTISGTATSIGTATFALNIGGQSCSFSVNVLSTPTITTTNSTICAGSATTLTATTTNVGTPCASTGLTGTLNNGLVGYWPFCGNANDASGNGNNGTVNGATLTADRFGNTNSAYNFDGVDDRIEIADNANQLIYGAQAPVTISCWILKTDNSVSGDIISKGYHSGTFSLGNKYLAYGYDPNAGKYTFSLYNATTLNSVQSPSSTTANQWAHMVIVRGASIKMYIDGVDIGINANNAGWNIDYNSILANSPINIGARNNLSAPNSPFWSDFWNGKLDDIGIWNRALTAAEIQTLYNQGQATYSWSPGGATTPSITVSPTATTTYTCTITQNGATTTQSQTITVNPVPTVNAGVDQTVFAGSPVTLSGAGASTYSWNNGVTNNVPFTATTTTTYTVTGTTNGCTATDAVLVTILPAPTITPTSSTICAGQSTTLTAASASTGTPCASTGLPGTLNNGLVGYWPFCGNANDASGNGNNGTVNGATLTADRFGNTNSAYNFDGNDWIDIQHSPIFEIFGSQENSTISVWFYGYVNQIGELIGKGFHSVNVPNFGNKYLSISNDALSYLLSLYNYSNLNSVRCPDNFFNTNQWYHLVFVRDFNLKAFVNGIDVSTMVNNSGWSTDYNSVLNNTTLSFGCRNVKDDNNIPFRDVFYNGKLDDIGIWNRALTAAEIQALYNQGQATYSWSPGGATTPSITVSPTTTTTYTCTITQNGASTTQSQTITVNPVPTVNAGVDQTVFAGSSVTLAGSGASTYSWNNGVTNNVPFTATTTTTYTVTGTTNGCTATDAVLVTVLPAATVSASNSTICAGASTTLTATTTNVGTPCASTGLTGTLNNGLVGYWPFCGNANDASGNGRNGIVSGATLTTDRFGNANSAYNFTGTTNSITIPNSNTLLPGSFSVSSWCTIENLMPSNYDATIIGQLNGSVANDRKWLFGYRSIANEKGISYYLFNNSGNFFLANNYTLNWQPIQSQWYHISWVFESNNTIKTYVNGVLHSSVAVNQATFNNIANNVLIKIGNASDVDSPLPLPWNGKIDDVALWNRVLTIGEIQALYNQGQATYSWSPGGATTPSITVSPTTTTTYTCTITQNGATTTQSQTITVNPVPTVNAGVDQTVFAGSPVTLSGAGASTYSWNNGVTNNTPFTATTTTTYTVTGTTNGCSATDAVLVTVLPAPTITPTNSTICAGASTTLTATTANVGTPCASTGLTGTLSNGLVGYWPFCGNANDASGNGNNGTVNGATLTADRFGNANRAFDFNATNDFIEIPVSNGLLNNQVYSISFWVKSSSTASSLVGMPNNHPAMISRLLPNSNISYDNFVIFEINGGVNFNSGSSAQVAAGYINGLGSNFNIFNNNWHNIVYSVGTDSCRTYLNGSPVYSQVVNGIINFLNTNIRLGRSQNTYWKDFSGILDDIGIWNRALTAAEIQTLYNQGQATYSWSPGGATTPSITVSPTTTTTYTCTITQNGATTTQSQTITVNPIPTVNAGVDQTVFAGSPVTLSGSGATTYSWNNGVTNNVPFTATTTTTYTLTGTTNGCSATDAVLVTVLPAATVSASNSTICAGASTTLTATTTNVGTPCASTGLTGTLSNGLVGYWPFCGNANDASGNGNNGTVNGATLTADRFGNANRAFNFNGNSNIKIPFTSSFTSQTGTISAWVKINSLPPSNDPQDCIFGKGWNYPQFLLRSDGKIYIQVTNGGINFISVGSSSTLIPNTWYLVSAKYSPTQLQVFINGALESTLNISASLFSYCNSEYFIGGFNHSNSCMPNDNVQNINAQIDDVMFWNRSLTAAEIQSLYTQGQATYSWSPGGATTPSITVSPTTTTTYTCTITQNGATTTQSQVITVNPVPTVNAGADQTVFTGSPVTLSGAGATSYTWNNGVTNNVPFTATTTTTYTVTGTTNGCSATDAVLVTVLPAPTITPTSSTICAGQSTTLTAASASTGTPCASTGLPGTLNNGLVGYWPFCGNANDASGNGNNGTVNGANLTTDRFGNTNSAYNFDGVNDNIIINNNNQLQTNIWSLGIWFKTSSNTLQRLTSKDSPSNPYNDISIIMENGQIYLSSSVNGQLNNPQPICNTYLANNMWHNVVGIRGNGQFQIYIDGTICASFQDNFNNLVNPNPLYIGSPSPFPSQYFNGLLDDIGIWNRALTAAEIQALYNQGQATYSWSPGGATTPSITVSPTTTTTYTCTITQNGATTTQSQTITVNPVPTVNAGVDQTVFAGTSVTLAGSGATTYTWNNGVTNNVPFTATTTTTYTVTGTTTGCTATDAVLVTVLPAPTITPTSSTICAGQSTTLTAASASTGTPCASTGLPGTLNNGLVGYWPFCGNANDASGNGNNGTVNGATLTADRFGNANSAYSFDGVNDNVLIQMNASLAPYGKSNYSYNIWFEGNPGNGILMQIFTGTSGQNISNYDLAYNNSILGFNHYPFVNNTNSPNSTPQLNWTNIHVQINQINNTISFYKNGVLWYSGIIGNLAPSAGLISIGALVNNLAAFNGKLDDIGIWNRALTAAEIQTLYNQGQATYSWSPGGATTPSITVSPSTTTTYTCTITQNGATTTQSQTITVNPVPTVNAGADQTVFAGSPVTLSGSGATTYTWNNGVTNNVPFTATTTTTYTVTGTTNGCSATDAVLVTVLPAPTITPTSSTICAGQSTTLTAASASTGTPCASTGLPGTLNNGLVGYWPFCGNANDVSGNGNNGTVNGATLTTDRFGNTNSAYSFDGVNDFINGFINNANLSDLTFSVWVNTPNTSGGTFVHLGSDNGSPFCNGVSLGNYNVPNTNLVGHYSCIGFYNSSSNFVANQWSHCTMVKQNNVLYFYVNGTLLSQVATSGFINPDNNFWFGSTYSNYIAWFLGKLDDIGIWNRALTAAEIQALYNQGQATYSWSPGGATTPSITVSPTTTTTYTCTITQNGATTTQSQTITVNPVPTVNAGADQTVFAGSSVTLAGSGATTYSWNNGVTNNVPFTATTTTTYTVTGTTNGCTATDAVLVTVLPAPTITPTSSTICAGQSTTLTAASASTGTPCASTGLPGTLNNGLVGYWPFCGNANDASGNGNNGTVNGATLTADRFGISNSAYSFDGVNDYVEVQSSALLNCNSSLSLSAWVNTNTISNDNRTIISRERYANGVSYQFTLTSSDVFLGLNNDPGNCGQACNSGTYASNSITLNSWQLLTATWDGNTVKLYSNGSLIQATNLTLGNGNQLLNSIMPLFIGKWMANTNNYPYQYFNGKLDDIGIWNRALTAAEIQALYNQGQATYSWSPGGATTPSITVSPSTTTTYTCTITQNGATTTQSQTITVNPVPTVNAGADQTVFAGSPVTLSGSGATTYTWNNGVTNNVPFTATTTTTYTVTGTTNGCSATDAVLVTVLPNATISANPGTTLCTGQSTTLTANVTNAATPCNASGLTGTLNNGLVGYWPFCGNANDVSGNGNNGTVNGATLTTDRFGNTNSAYSFDGIDDFIDFGNVSNLGNNPINATYGLWVKISDFPVNNPYPFQSAYPILSRRHVDNNGFDWCTQRIESDGKIKFFKDGDGYLGNQASSSIIQLNSWKHFIFVKEGNTLRVYESGQLISSITDNYILNGSPLNLYLAKHGGWNWYYKGQLDDIGIWNRALTASEIQTLYNQGQATYSWSPGGATTPSITVSPTTTTTYTCTVTLNGASSTVSQTVTVNPSPVVAITTNPGQTVCAGTPVTLTASGASSYSWNNGVSNGLAFVPTATQTYTVIGTNSFGCTDTETTTVTVNPTPTATISYTGSLILCQGSTITLTASPGSSYLWSSGQTTQSITVGQTGSYSVQVFNASGCSATSTPVNVTVNPLPAPTIIASGPTTFCQGQQVTLTSSGAQSYLWNTSATTQSINVNTSGTYTVTVVDNKGCSGTSAPIQVTVIDNPPANINVIGGTSICAGQTTTLSAPAGAGFSYLWNTGAQTQFLTVSQTGTYTVQVTNAGGCSTISASVTITVNPLPSSIVIASGPTSFCPGQSVLLTAPPANSYLWSNGATTASILVTTTGNYSVQLTGQGGCTVTSTPIAVTVFTLPAPTIFASGPTTFCQGGSVILSAPSGYTYLWTNGNTTQNIVVTNSGTYQVYISNSNGCQILSNPATVVVNPLPNVNAGMDQTVCSGTPVTLIASGASTFTWNNGVTNGVAFVPTTTQTYTVTGTNNFGCTAQDQVTVFVNPLPTVSAGPPQSICAGQSAVLVGTGAQFYLWSNGVINGVPFTPSSTQTYTVTGYNAAGCSNTATTTITVNPLPTALAGANATIICSNSATGVQIGAAPVAGQQYLWSPATGLSSTTVANPFANPTVTTLYNLLVTNSATGCSNQGTVTVNVNTAGPIASAGPNVEILCSSPNGLQIGTSPVLGLNYSWSPSTGLSATNIANPIANPSATTSYNLTVTNPTTGCSSTAAVTVFVNNTSPTVNAGPDQQVCQGDPVTLTASGLNANTYTWSNGVSNGVPFVPTSSGTYTLTGTNSANGCVSTDVVNITVNPLPIVNAGPDQTICAGSAVVLSGSGALTYTWNNNVTNGAPFVPTATLTYTVTGTNANGCSATDNVMVTVGPGIIVNAGPDVTICAGSPVTLTATGANSYSWTNGVVNGQSFVPTATQTYTVTGTNPNGCSGTDQVTVTVVPNPTPVITPSGNISLCPNGSIVLSTTSGALYQWRLNGTDIPGANAQNYTATAAGVYTVKVTNANGCSAIATAVSISLATATQPIVTANGSTNICNGGSVQFSTTGINAVQWYLNGLPISGATNLNYTANSAGSYTVGGQTSAGCTVLSTPTLVTLATIAAPNIIANGPTTICIGSSFTLSTSAVGTYQWLSNGSPIAGATNATLNINQPGNYALIYTNSAGCSATSAVTSITLGTPTAPTITPNGPLSLCNGGSVFLSATAAASYQWKLNGTNIAGATSQTYTANSAGGYTVTVVYPNGCSATSSVTMVNGSIVTTPVIVVNGSTSLCPGSSVELIASGSGSYQWLLNGNPIGTSSPNLMANTTGSYTVTVTNSAGCFATSLPTILTASTLTPPTINPAPTATFCPGGSVVLSTNATGNIQWKLNNQNISGATLPNLTCSNQGSYTITVSAGGCTITSAPTTVTMASAPTVSLAANGNTLICPGSSVQLNVTATPGSTLQWFRNGSPIGNFAGQNYNASLAGNYQVIATNAAGCQTTSNTITVNVVQVSLQATGSTTICQGSSVVLQASTGAGYTYQWIKNGNIAMQITGVSSYTAGVSGTYSVIIYTPNGCAITTNTIQVQVIANPTVSIIATGNTTICSGSSITLIANTTGSALTYQWKRNGVNVTPNGNSSSLSVTQAGTYTVTVANQTCPSSSVVNSNAITVTVNPTPTPNISTSATIIPLGGSVTLSTTPVAGLSYQWQKLNGNNFQNIQNATGTSYQANTAGTYRVRATNASGCTGTSATINLTLFQLPVIEDPLKMQKGIVVEMYPNPTDNLLHIVVPDSLLGKYLQLMDINGKILQTVELFQKHSVLEMQNYARGTYWIKIEDEQPIQVIRN